MGPQDVERYKAHYRENVKLIVQILIIWAAVSFGATVIVKTLDSFKFLTGFPFGYYMGAQGSLIVFVILIFYYAYRMGKIDEKYGVEE